MDLGYGNTGNLAHSVNDLNHPASDSNLQMKLSSQQDEGDMSISHSPSGSEMDDDQCPSNPGGNLQGSNDQDNYQGSGSQQTSSNQGDPQREGTQQTHNREDSSMQSLPLLLPFLFRTVLLSHDQNENSEGNPNNNNSRNTQNEPGNPPNPAGRYSIISITGRNSSSLRRPSAMGAANDSLNQRRANILDGIIAEHEAHSGDQMDHFNTTAGIQPSSGESAGIAQGGQDLGMVN